MILSLETATKICAVALHDKGKLIAEKYLDIEHAHSSQLTVLIEAILQETHTDKKALQAVAVSVEALALPIRERVEANALLCPMLDARRMEVYCAIFDTAGKPISPTEAKIIDQESFADILQHQKIVFFGEGAGKCQTLLQHENALFLDHVLPTADSIGKLAYTRYENQQFEDLAYFEPLYLKDFVNNTKVK
ncbi:MAG: tRNA (adenosine(37)-N6)-threonylcarbamoyltransferase complex dimerization subunit type 1 TsaB [Bacteroidetes bacterium]|nr:MAG: tRNA (adenosine(37)-N6)-threonylcarbamoyltransferase complex dimerization subunit type 1 TsaB [Bacteroidota bacterium]